MTRGSVWEELCARKKAQIIKLQEVSDVTRRLAEAVDRRDELSARMLLGERDQPLTELQQMESELRAYVASLPEERAIRAGELLRGAEAESAEEAPLAEQAARYRRVLSGVLDLDRKLSLRLGGNRSFYKTYRE